MEKSVVSRTLSVHQEHELLLRLEKAGLTGKFAQRVIENPALAERVVAHIKRGGHWSSISQQRAREIMKENFFGAEEVAEHLGFLLNNEELSEIAKVPFSEKRLQECKDTYILFLGVDHDRTGKPLTILRLSEIFSDEFYWKDWWKKEEFATKETPKLQWYLVRKSILEESRFKTFSQQEKLLKKNEYRERAVVYAYRMLLIHKTRGESLLEGWVMCKDLTSSNERVGIGYYIGGLQFFHRSDNDSGQYLVLALAIKPEI